MTRDPDDRQSEPAVDLEADGEAEHPDAFDDDGDEVLEPDLADAPTPDLLLVAYLQGIFPMADPDTGAVDWYSPDPRGIMPLDEGFHVPRTVGRQVRAGDFEVVSDRDFAGVMRACAGPRATEPDTWIDERLVTAYSGLHERGFAHSVEAWRGGRLVGGLYGVHIGAAFFGESMFVRPELGGTGASKVCLVHLVEHLRAIGGRLLDTQFTNPHLERFGCVEIPRDEYLRRLEDACRRPVDWTAGPLAVG
jgi:leucyl/phenylalanyl-tRNA--protein transferase